MIIIVPMQSINKGIMTDVFEQFGNIPLKYSTFKDFLLFALTEVNWRWIKHSVQYFSAPVPFSGNSRVISNKV